ALADDVAVNVTLVRRRSRPNVASGSWGCYLRPGITWPPLRPEPPKPGCFASRTTTRTPPSARCSAVDSPAYPPPITQTSALVESTSGGVDGGGGAVAAHSEGSSGKGSAIGSHRMQDALEKILRARVARVRQQLA